jgi:hypothetical protein
MDSSVLFPSPSFTDPETSALEIALLQKFKPKLISRVYQWNFPDYGISNFFQILNNSGGDFNIFSLDLVFINLNQLEGNYLIAMYRDYIAFKILTDPKANARSRYRHFPSTVQSVRELISINSAIYDGTSDEFEHIMPNALIENSGNNDEANKERLLDIRDQLIRKLYSKFWHYKLKPLYVFKAYFDPHWKSFETDFELQGYILSKITPDQYNGYWDSVRPFLETGDIPNASMDERLKNLNQRSNQLFLDLPSSEIDHNEAINLDYLHPELWNSSPHDMETSILSDFPPGGYTDTEKGKHIPPVIPDEYKRNHPEYDINHFDQILEISGGDFDIDSDDLMWVGLNSLERGYLLAIYRDYIAFKILTDPDVHATSRYRHFPGTVHSIRELFRIHYNIYHSNFIDEFQNILPDTLLLESDVVRDDDSLEEVREEQLKLLRESNRLAISSRKRHINDLFRKFSKHKIRPLNVFRAFFNPDWKRGETDDDLQQFILRKISREQYDYYYNAQREADNFREMYQLAHPRARRGQLNIERNEHFYEMLKKSPGRLITIEESSRLQYLPLENWKYLNSRT